MGGEREGHRAGEHGGAESGRTWCSDARVLTWTQRMRRRALGPSRLIMGSSRKMTPGFPATSTATATRLPCSLVMRPRRDATRRCWKGPSPMSSIT